MHFTKAPIGCLGPLQRIEMGRFSGSKTPVGESPAGWVMQFGMRYAF